MESLSFNYASALFGLCDKSQLDSYATALKEIDSLLKQEKDFLRLLSSRQVALSEKEELLRSTIGKQYDLPHLLDFHFVLAAHHRFGIYSRVVEDFVSLVNEATGVKEGIVYSALALTEKELGQLQKAFEKKLGCGVSLKNIVDASLLGGIKVALDGKVYDGSIRNRIQDLHHTLKGGSL